MWCLCVYVSPWKWPKRTCLLKSLDITASKLFLLLHSNLFSSLFTVIFSHTFLLPCLAHFSRDGVAWTLPYHRPVSTYANCSAVDSVTQDSYFQGQMPVCFPFKILLYFGQTMYVFFSGPVLVLVVFAFYFFHLTMDHRCDLFFWSVLMLFPVCFSLFSICIPKHFGRNTWINDFGLSSGFMSDILHGVELPIQKLGTFEINIESIHYSKTAEWMCICNMVQKYHIMPNPYHNLARQSWVCPFQTWGL